MINHDNSNERNQQKLNAKDRYRALTRDLTGTFPMLTVKMPSPYEEFEGIKITDWSKWEDPFRLTMDAYWKYQAEKEKNFMPFLMRLLKTTVR